MPLPQPTPTQPTPTYDSVVKKLEIDPEKIASRPSWSTEKVPDPAADSPRRTTQPGGRRRSGETAAARA